MKFAIGYQMPEEGEEPFLEMVRDFQEHIAEVYFPWADIPSGRAPLTSQNGYTDWTAQERLEEDLAALRQMGIKLDLLFNANCYGSYAVSRFLENQVVSLLEHLQKRVNGVDTVTTTSLAVARTVKRHFPKVEVRASVNMRIGTIGGMQYVEHLFDGFHVQREFNRDLDHLRRLKEWADGRNKKLYMLANSGCLAFCSGQTFHDNLVAHEQEIDEMRNVPGWSPTVCWEYYSDKAHWPSILQATWVRPENLHHYENSFSGVKLATRMHSRPRIVLQAYAEGRFHGNLLDLFGPGFSPAFAPYIIDNDKFPADWFERTSSCSRRCETCSYCRDVLDQTQTNMSSSQTASNSIKER